MSENRKALFLRDVRLAFPCIWKADKVNASDAEAKFSALFILEGGHPQLAEVRAALLEAAKTQWADEAGAVVKKLKATNRLALHSGEEKEEYAGFTDDNFFVSSNNPSRPTIVDRDGRTQLVEDDGRPYSGCYVNAFVAFWAQDNQHGKRVNGSLEGIQFLRDGEAFSGGGRVASVDDFPDEGEYDGSEAAGDLEEADDDPFA